MSSTMKYRIKVFRQYKDLILELVKRDIKLKYRRSFLGYVWSVLNPLLIMIVMTIVFSAMFNKTIENYPIYLFTGRMLFECMRNGVTSQMIETVFSLGAFFIVMFATKTPFHWQLVFLPRILIQLYIFTLGLSFLLAEMNVFFHDIEYIYHAFATAWQYLTPLFYPIERLPNVLQVCIKAFNPMYCYIWQFRDIALYGQTPGPRIVIMGWIWAFAMLAVGLWRFQKQKDRFILYI